MTNTLKELGIKFGKKEVAKNLSYFRRSVCTEAFWDYYKEHKQELKDNGYSVYKLNDKFYLYNWTCKDKATQHEYDQQEEKKFNLLLNEYLLLAEDAGNDLDYSWIKNIDDLKKSIEEEAENPDVFWDNLVLNCSAYDIEYEEEIFEEGKDYFTTEESYNEAICKINAKHEEGCEPYDYLVTDNFADYKYKEIINDYQIFGLNEKSNQFLVIKESDDHSEWLKTYFFVNHTPEEIKKFLLDK